MDSDDNGYVIGVAVGMEYADGIMRMDTSWTTAVCFHGDTIVATRREFTTPNDVFNGVELVLQNVLQEINPDNVTRVNIGTPQILNAIVDQQNLSPVTVVRLCGPSTQALLPFVDVPDDIKPQIIGDIHLLNGGYEFSGNPGANEEITPVNVEEVLQCIKDIDDTSIEHVVICGVYSPDKCDQEHKVARLFNKYSPHVNVTLSHEVVSKNGLLERENASILNASLKKVFKDNVKKFAAVLEKVNLKADLFIVENNEKLTSGEDLTGLKFPVKTLFSLKACTMKAAPFLSGIKYTSFIVIDIGSTVSTAGILAHGHPRFQTSIVDVSGIRLYSNNAYMVPYNFGLFSIVHYSTQEHEMMVGPDCVDLHAQALVYGGNVLTCLDIAVAAGLIVMGDPKAVEKLDRDLISQALDKIHDMIEDLIDMAMGSSEPIPVVLLGLGSVLIDETKPLQGTSHVVKPKNFKVADAVGAAIMGRMPVLHQASCPLDFESDGHVQTVPHSLGSSGEKLSKEKGHHLVKTSQNGNQSKSIRRAYQKRQNRTNGVRARSEQHSSDSGDDPDPEIDIKTGEWLLSESDLVYLSIGVGILGSGGGGSPYLAKLLGTKQLKNGNKIRVIVPERLGLTDNLKGLAAGIGFIGDPKVVIEKLPNGMEGRNCLKCMADLYCCGYHEGLLSWKPAGTVTETTCGETVFIKRFPAVYNTQSEQGHNLVALMPLEIGGMNGIQPLVVSAMTDMPVLDCDGMGRAIPELQMYGPSIYGNPLHPSTLSGYKGERIVALKVNTPHDLEIFFRNHTIQMGSVAVFATGPLDEKAVNEHTVKYTISQAWRIGKGVIDARKNQQDPIQSILDNENGKLLIRNGKVTRLSSTHKGGFGRGRYTVAGVMDGEQVKLTIDFQNENLVAWKGDPADCKVMATIPDLISLVDEDGNPITTDAVHFGLHASVLALPCSPIMRTGNALAKCGPRVLGYDFDYKPIGEYKIPIPVPPMP